MRNSYQTCFGTKGKEKRDSISLLFDISCLYVQFRQAVDGILLQFIYGAGIFLDVLQSAMPKDAGDSLDVVAIVEEVHSARMAGTVPTDMLVDAGTFHPSLHRLAATLVGREIEDEGFLGLPFSRSVNLSDEAVVEGNRAPAFSCRNYSSPWIENAEFAGEYFFPPREENNYHAITTDWFHAKLKGNKLKVTFERNEMTTEKPIVLTVTASDIFYTFKFKQFANR